MVRIITFAMNAQNSIFPSSLKNEKIISSFFSYCLSLSLSPFSYFTKQKKFIMLPDVTHSRTYNDAVF